MLRERFVFEVLPDCFDDAVTVLKTALSDTFRQGRVFRPIYAPFDQVIVEITFDSLADLEQFWAVWWDTPPAKSFAKQFDPLITGDGRSEVWEVHEPVQLAVTGKYVNWRCTKIKPGHVEETQKILLAAREDTNRYDILLPTFGPINRVAMVFEFDSLDDYEQEWVDWVNTVATPQFWQDWARVTNPGGENTVWMVV
ncbi:MAG TPA: hypothetical protein PJ988_19250 [Anaerolinea sp.]|nr:hypothetical protein [Anaerolinea sp.]